MPAVPFSTRPYKSLLLQYRGVMFAVRTTRREPEYHTLRTTLGDALIEAAEIGAGVRMKESTADNIAAYLLDGMIPCMVMPADYAPVEAEIQAALDRGTEASRARARGLAQALAMLKLPRSWAWADSRSRAAMVKKEMAEWTE